MLAPSARAPFLLPNSEWRIDEIRERLAGAAAPPSPSPLPDTLPPGPEALGLIFDPEPLGMGGRHLVPWRP